MGRDRAVRAGAMLFASIVFAACTDAPTASPTSAGPPTATATATPIESPSQTPLETAAATPLPTQAAAAGDWRAVLNQEAVSSAQFQDVVWTGQRFVAVGGALTGGGVFVSSTDGQRWRSLTSGGSTGSPDRLAVGPKGIVAVGTLDGHTAAWHSTDGRSWTYRLKIFPRALSDDDVVRVTDVVATPTGWLAVGRDDPICQTGCGETPRRALVWTSTDAVAWTRVAAQASLSKAAINAVTAIDGGFLAVGQAAGRATIWTSTDGLTWKRIADDPMFGPPSGATSGATVAAVGAAAGNGSMVAVGMAYGAAASGAPVVLAWRSADGQTWTPATVEGAEEGQVFSVASTTTGFLATGPSGDTSCLGGIWSSTGPDVWSCVASDDGFAGFGAYAAAGSPTVDVAVGLTEVGWDPNGTLGMPGAVWWRPVR